jgi:glycosyltransferase involved in cell wall biosynthesis
MANIRDSLLDGLAGKRILVLNWRDIFHPQAGGAEQYMHEISTRWVEARAEVTWITSRGERQPKQETIDGIEVSRAGGPLSLYPMSALKLLRNRARFDAVVDCQNGIPFFSPLFVHREVPVVQVVHHVHQEQFKTRFSPPMAALGRFLEGTAARTVYGTRAIAAVSPSTRLELRRLGYGAPIFVVPNGSISVPPTVGPRDPDPTITVVTRLVPHKRIDLLLSQIAVALRSVPRLRVDIVGDGSELPRLRQVAIDLGLYDAVRFHGYQPNQIRDQLLNRAWLTVCTSAAEGWGCSIVEAAAWGVPCLALRVPGIRDSVVDGQTGWLVDSPREFGEALVARLSKLSETSFARETAAKCQAWARCFTWDRSASLLAGVLLEEEAARTSEKPLQERNKARSDMSTLARFHVPSGLDLRASLRATDEIAEDGKTASVILNGRDEYDAAALMAGLGISDVELDLVGSIDLLAGPLGIGAFARSETDVSRGPA